MDKIQGINVHVRGQSSVDFPGSDSAKRDDRQKKMKRKRAVEEYDIGKQIFCNRQKKMKKNRAEETFESLAYDHTVSTFPGQVLEIPKYSAGRATLSRSEKFFERKKQKLREAREKREKERRKEEQQRNIRLKAELGNPEAFNFKMMRSKPPNEFDTPKKKKQTAKKKKQTRIKKENEGYIFHEVRNLKKEIESLIVSLVIRGGNQVNRHTYFKGQLHRNETPPFASESDVKSKRQIEESNILETKKNRVRRQLEMKIQRQSQAKKGKLHKGRLAERKR